MVKQKGGIESEVAHAKAYERIAGNEQQPQHSRDFICGYFSFNGVGSAGCARDPDDDRWDVGDAFYYEQVCDRFVAYRTSDK